MTMLDKKSTEELVRKYKLAGKIRFISFSLLLLFLFLMKFIGGYSYLNMAFVALILVEAIANQPYYFTLKRVDIRRFQYFQMMTDIIVITWVIHYMGGIEAPLISIAYYAVILWAGVVSTTQAVFFAVIASAVFFSSVVICEHFGIIPFVSYYDYRMSTPQMISVLFGNVSFIFAFGYFSAHSSRVIKFLDRKRQEVSLHNIHKLLATGYLVGNTVHDTLNYITALKGYTKILLEEKVDKDQEKEVLETIDRLGCQSAELLSSLMRFSRKPKQEFKPTNVNKVIEDTLDLTWPIVRYTEVAIEKVFGSDVPGIMADRDQLQEVFVAFILNALDAIPGKGILTVKTSYIEKEKAVEIAFSDTGRGIREENLKNIGEPFFTTKGPERGLGLGLATAYGIVAQHDGKVSVKSTLNKGTTFTLKLPLSR